MVVGGHQGLDALDGSLMNFESAQVLQVEVNLLNVGPVQLDLDCDGILIRGTGQLEMVGAIE